MSTWVKHTLSTAALAAAIGGTTPASAALTDVFIRLSGITGESKDAKHKGEIDAVSWSWGTTTPTSRATSGASSAAVRPVFDQLTFVKTIDSASPQLLQCATSGKHIPEVVLTVRMAGKSQIEYIRLKLKDVSISFMKLTGGSSDSVVPLEEIGLSFTALEYSVAPIGPNGTPGTPITASFNFSTGKP
jgi:type VI secretion system secreted protein Hcp